MENAVKQRIKDILSHNGSNINTLSKAIGIPQNTLNRQINGGTTIPVDTVLSIIGLYNTVSAEWLLRGEGSMLKEETSPSPSVADSSLVEELKAEINQLKGENRILREQIGLGERKDGNVKSA